VAGQYGSSPDGGVASPLFAEQVRRALANLGIALAAHDLAFADVVSLRTYVVAIDFEKLGVFAEAMKATWGEQPPPNTLVGVASLATPDIAFEVEAIAARP
jgi:enamine deaminase RidA (YjgF/YER057c/UK114 family)